MKNYFIWREILLSVCNTRDGVMRLMFVFNLSAFGWSLIWQWGIA